MTRLEVLEQELYENNIKIIQDNLETFDAVTLKIDNTVIILDKSRYKTEQEKFIILSHEKTHAENPSTLYTFDTSLNKRKYRETKVNRQLYKELLPMSKFKSLLEQEYTINDIANMEDLPSDFVYEAFNYYNDILNWRC
jgi:hypothetical protein